MILLLWGCGGQPTMDPELETLGVAVSAWTLGADALHDGRIDEAVTSLTQATEARPQDLLLRAWLAEALGRAGRFDAALATWDSVLSVNPEFSEARYGRAVLMVKMGNLSEAAADLEVSIADDWERARNVRNDPDFSEVLDLPIFAFVPRDTLLVSLDPPQGLLFWGGETTLRIRVVGAGDAPIAVGGPEVNAPIRITRVVESTTQSTAGPLRDLNYTLVPTGAGDVAVLGWTVSSGSWSAPLPELRLRLAAPPDREAVVLPIDLRTPAAVLATLAEADARFNGGHLWVAGRVDDRVVVTPDPGPPTREYVLTSPDGSRAAWEWTGLTRVPSRVVVQDGSTKRWDGPPQLTVNKR